MPYDPIAGLHTRDALSGCANKWVPTSEELQRAAENPGCWYRNKIHERLNDSVIVRRAFDMTVNDMVLKGVSLEVPDSSIIALLGANGGGKSTMLKAISGLLKTEEGEITDGSVELDGEQIEHMEPAEIVKRGIIQVMEGRMVFEHLSVDENLEAGHYVRRRQTNLNSKRILFSIISPT